MPAESYLVDTAVISFGRISAETYDLVFMQHLWAEVALNCLGLAKTVCCADACTAGLARFGRTHAALDE